MEIIWNGDSNFLIKTFVGKKICFDPFNAFKTLSNNINYDIITLSQDITNCEKSSHIGNNTKVIFGSDTYSEKDIKLKGYLTYSDKVKGLKRGLNYIYTLEDNSIKLCHLGYLGEMLNGELIQNLKFMDFLFVPIGGEMCLDGFEANRLCSILCPKYIIPMCYNLNGSNFYFDGPKKFLSHCKNFISMNSNTISINNLPTSKDTITLLLK